MFEQLTNPENHARVELSITETFVQRALYCLNEFELLTPHGETLMATIASVSKIDVATNAEMFPQRNNLFLRLSGLFATSDFYAPGSAEYEYYEESTRNTIDIFSLVIGNDTNINNAAEAINTFSSGVDNIRNSKLRQFGRLFLTSDQDVYEIIKPDLYYVELPDAPIHRMLSRTIGLSFVRKIISEVFLLDSYLTNRSKSINSLADLIEITLINLNAKKAEYVVKRYNPHKDHINGERYMRSTEESMLRSKSPEQPPSFELRYSVQTIVYDEMPVGLGRRVENPRGNLAEYLMSAFKAAIRYKTEGHDPQEIEILINVNNKPSSDRLSSEELFAFQSNRNALELIRLLKTPANPDSLVSQMSWIEPSDKSTVDFYLELIALAQQLLGERGMQLHGIDCTDGSHIALYRFDGNYPKIAANSQGSRRRLIATIAQARFNGVRTQNSSITENNQVNLVTDCDALLSESAFIDLAETYRVAEHPTILVSTLKIVEDPYFDYSPENTTNISVSTDNYIRAKYGYLDLEFVAKNLRNILRIPRSRYPPLHSGFVETIACAASAYRKTQGWDIYKNELEDTTFHSALRGTRARYIHLHKPLVIRKDRLGNRSWLGNLAHRYLVQGSNSWTELKSIEWSSVSTALLGEEIPPRKFAGLLWAKINSLQDLSPEELSLLNRLKNTRVMSLVYDEEADINPSLARMNISLFKLVYLGTELEDLLNQDQDNIERYRRLANIYCQIGKLLP